MSEFLCKNCGKPMKAVWNDETGYEPEHYDSDCNRAEFTEDDEEVLDNDYAK